MADIAEPDNRTGNRPAMAPVSRRAVLLGLLGATAVGCGGGGPGAAANGTASGAAGGAAPTVVDTPIMVNGKEANFRGAEIVTGKSSITMGLYDFYFEPTVLVGSPGQTLTVNLVNQGEVPHTFTLRDQNVDVVLQPGQEGRAEIVFPQSGEEGFVCRFHIAQGMLGQLVVKS